ncbi:MAG: phosphotransferase [Candidatus Scalindua sp.]
MTSQPKTKQHRQKSNKKRRPKFDHKLAAVCEGLIGSPVESMEFPGGRSRKSVRLLLKKGDPVYVSIRSKIVRADVETQVLKTVSRAGENVPKLLASNGQKLLIQQEIPGIRLSQAIDEGSDKEVLLHLDNALQSLSSIQKAGSKHGLDSLSPLGNTHKWIIGLLDRPAVLGRYFKIAAPRPDLRALESLLAIRKPRFIKWDARPGNAITKNNGEVFWIDWEHSGTRNRLDDMVWLLADEFVPDLPEVDTLLLDRYLPSFCDDLSLDQARKYFFAFGVFHLTVRMGLILKYKKGGSWWRHEKCLKYDKAGVTLKCAVRICRRGARWAAENPETLVLSQWFKDVEATLK